MGRETVHTCRALALLSRGAVSVAISFLSEVKHSRSTERQDADTGVIQRTVFMRLFPGQESSGGQPLIFSGWDEMG